MEENGPRYGGGADGVKGIRVKQGSESKGSQRPGWQAPQGAWGQVAREPGVFCSEDLHSWNNESKEVTYWQVKMVSASPGRGG